MSSKHNGVDIATDWARRPPPSLPIGRRIVNVLYNHEEKSFLGRTPKRWGIFLTFYLCFYAGLALLFSICFGALYYTVDLDRPYYELGDSLIGTNPGLDFRPRNEDAPLLQYALGNGTSIDQYLLQARNFLKGTNPGLDFRPRNEDAPLLQYALGNGTSIDQYLLQARNFLKDYENSSWFKSQKECNDADNYGFPETPCFYIKLNKIFGWIPQVYDGVKNAFPEDMPEDLQSYIMSQDLLQRQQVWLSCEEEKHNTTSIEYPWGRGLPARYYPFINTPAYKSPILAVKLSPPTNNLTSIRCRYWAKNIIYNKSLKEPSGYTRIQLFIEDNYEETEE